MSYNLFLDDNRIPHKSMDYMHPDIASLYRTLKWVVVRSYYEFVKTIEEKGLPDLISFDHDLADVHYDIRSEGFNSWKEYYESDDEHREMTGYDCAKWLVNYCMENQKPIPKYYIHSMNDIGMHNIRTYLENYKKHS